MWAYHNPTSRVSFIAFDMLVNGGDLKSERGRFLVILVILVIFKSVELRVE